ncbi:hypothetical protein QUB75_27085 [Microcoleus sp. K1-B6]|uniref:hypothetical protein n=1 Tax=unclassified Microcoleus TaxID=2642155 RepID=UPI002FCF1DF8
MNKPNDLIIYGNGLYEIERETETQYCLHERYLLTDSHLVCGWIDKNDFAIGKERILGNDLYKIQLVMVAISDRQILFDPID